MSPSYDFYHNFLHWHPLIDTGEPVTAEGEAGRGCRATNQDSTQSSARHQPVAVCVELVGSRFLRRMVRLLVVRYTAFDFSLLFVGCIRYINCSNRCRSSTTVLSFLTQGTAIRESMLIHDPDPSDHSSREDRKEVVRDEDILLRICRSRDRAMAAKALPGIGIISSYLTLC
jgi:hypothetical protein